MADQKVKIESDSGSPERVALELMQYIRYHDKNTRAATEEKQALIDLYVDCLYATRFDRTGGR